MIFSAKGSDTKRLGGDEQLEESVKERSGSPTCNHSSTGEEGTPGLDSESEALQLGDSCDSTHIVKSQSSNDLRTHIARTETLPVIVRQGF